MSSHWSRMTAKGFSFWPVNKFDNLSIGFNVAPNESLTACRNQSEGLSLLLSTPSLRQWGEGWAFSLKYDSHNERGQENYFSNHNDYEEGNHQSRGSRGNQQASTNYHIVLVRMCSEDGMAASREMKSI